MAKTNVLPCISKHLWLISNATHFGFQIISIPWMLGTIFLRDPYRNIHIRYKELRCQRIWLFYPHQFSFNILLKKMFENALNVSLPVAYNWNIKVSRMSKQNLQI